MQRGEARARARRWLAAALALAALAGAGAWRPGPGPRALPVTPAAPRARRHAPGDTRHIQLLGWHLELRENTAIRSPYYDECQFYTGRVLDEDRSSATLTECGDQLYGLLQVDGEEFVLQPTTGREHVLRRRDVMLSEQPASYNLTGDTVPDLELDLSDDNLPPTPAPTIRRRHSFHSDIEEYQNIMTVSRPASGVCKSQS